MNIIERGQEFLQSLRELWGRSAWDWKRRPKCESTLTIKNGGYRRRPWYLTGRKTERVQRHWCYGRASFYSEESALLVRGSWYAREVHRAAVDHWQHLGTSVWRTAEVLRSWMGRQERWRLWCPVDATASEPCYLGASTVQRWLDGVGKNAQASIPRQLTGIQQTQVVATDGLWVKLKGNAQRVVLLVVDSVTGLVYPPLVAKGEESVAPWQFLFERAKQAGLELDALRGVTSDGARGLLAYLRQGLDWVLQQRCVWHLWRTIGREISRAAANAAAGLCDEAAEQVRKQVREELDQLVRRVMDAGDYAQAEAALVLLLAHPHGAPIGQLLNEQLDRVLVHLLDYYQGLQRVTPEWYWWDFRLRHGRNQRSDLRLERAALVWAHLPQLRACSKEVRTQTTLSTPRSVCPRSRRCTPWTSQLPRCSGGLSAPRPTACYPQTAASGGRPDTHTLEPVTHHQQRLKLTNTSWNRVSVSLLRLSRVVQCKGQTPFSQFSALRADSHEGP